MNLRLLQYNSLQATPHKKNTIGTSKAPLRKTQNEPNFTSSNTFKRTFDRATRKIVYTNANKVIETIDGIVGNKAFSRAVKRAGIDYSSDTITVKNRSFLDDFIETIKVPFITLPMELRIGILEGMKNRKIFKKFAQDALESPSVKAYKNSVAKEKCYTYVREMLNNFSDSKDDCELNINSRVKIFKRKFDEKVVNEVPNYNTRDERTLNRIATSTVSALYSGSDFYNISMLQKDDEQEAKKSRNARMKQEFSRMALSAGVTFVSMGVLNKHVKSTFANAGIIAASALFSEVISRLVAGTPLFALKPEQAAKIARARKEKQKQKEAELNKTTNIEKEQPKNNSNQNNKAAFKGSVNSNNRIHNLHNSQIIFGDFAQKDGTFTPINNITTYNIQEAMNDKQQIGSNKNKKMDLKTKIILLFAAVNVFCVLKNAARGKYDGIIKKDKFYNKHSEAIKKYLDDKSELPREVEIGIEKIKNECNRKAKRFTLFDEFKDFILKKNDYIDVSVVKNRLSEIKASAEGKKVEKIIDSYLSQIKDLEQRHSLKQITIRNDKNLLISSISEGFAKVFKNIYSVLTLPNMFLNCLVDKHFEKTNKVFKEINDKMKYRDEICSEDELVSLAKLMSLDKIKNKKLNFAQREKLNKETVAKILKASEIFETKIETGELAGISRTFVTIISTFFFVNDYTNKVLIESEGKNIEGAKEERNERIAHKVANFFINGTLMNLFNSVFKTALNQSLLKAMLIAAATETTNEFLVRKSICQPVLPQKSRDDIIEYEQKQLNNPGLMGDWSRFFRKITGKKSLTQKAGIKLEQKNN